MKSLGSVVRHVLTSMGWYGQDRKAGRRGWSTARPLSIIPASLLLSSLLLVGVVPAAAPAPVAAGCGGCLLPADWPQFRNDATRAGFNDQEYQVSASNVGALSVAWTGTTGLPIWSSPVVANNRVYVGSIDGTLYAYAVGCNRGAGTCSPLWTAATGANIDSSPAVANGVVYLAGEDGHFHAYDAATGATLWTAVMGASSSSPVVANGVVYVGSADHTLYAFDAAGITGCSGAVCTPLWTATTGAVISSSPAVANGVVYVGSQDDTLYAYAVGCASGGGSCSPLWTATTGDMIQHSSPAVANGVVYVGSFDNKLYAFDAAGVTRCSAGTCSPLWTATTGGAIYSSPAVANGVVYVGSEDAKLYAYAVGCASGGGSCSPLWTATTGAPIAPSPAVANGAVYIGSSDHHMYAYDAAGVTNCSGGTCSPLWNWDIGHAITSSPAVSNGVVYVGALDSKLYAFGLDGATYHPLTPPVRMLDTRTGLGLSGRLVANTPATFQVSGRLGVPGNASAVTGNVTVVNSSNSWAVYLGPNPVAHPPTSTINFAAGQIAGNGLTVALGASGSLSATYMSSAGNTTDLVFDVTGYFTPDTTGATYHALALPVRLLDTRVGTGFSGRITANTPATFPVAGVAASLIPPWATAVTGNVTVVNPSNSWAVYLGPIPQASPTTSTINFNAGEVKGNNLTVALGSGGTLSATYISTPGNTTDLVFDVTGYYTDDLTGDRFVPIAPERLLDTRVGTGLSTRLTANTPATFFVGGEPGIAFAPVAVTGNVTVVNETNSWAVYVGPNPIVSPTTSTINFVTGEIKGNGLTVGLKSTGSLSATYMSSPGNTTDLIFDVTGYFVP